MNKLLVTGSSGLIGSEVVEYFCKLGWEVHGVDNNMRADFFGAGGDTRWNQRRLLATHNNFHHHELDIRDRAGVDALIATIEAGPCWSTPPPNPAMTSQRPGHSMILTSTRSAPESAGSRAAARAGRGVCAHEHQQGLWRPAQHTSG